MSRLSRIVGLEQQLVGCRDPHAFISLVDNFKRADPFQDRVRTQGSDFQELTVLVSGSRRVPIRLLQLSRADDIAPPPFPGVVTAQSMMQHDQPLPALYKRSKILSLRGLNVLNLNQVIQRDHIVLLRRIPTKCTGMRIDVDSHSSLIVENRIERWLVVMSAGDEQYADVSGL